MARNKRNPPTDPRIVKCQERIVHDQEQFERYWLKLTRAFNRLVSYRSSIRRNKRAIRRYQEEAERLKIHRADDPPAVESPNGEEP
jgi:hypothetical protein